MPILLKKDNLSAFLSAAIAYVENVQVFDPNSDPYAVFHASPSSGLSMGKMQADTTTPIGQKLLADALQANGVPEAKQARILKAAADPSAPHNQWIALNPELQTLTKYAHKIIPEIAQADQNRLDTDIGYVNDLLKVVSNSPNAGIFNPNDLNPTAMALVGAWVNNTNEPEALTAYIAEIEKTRLVTLADLVAYLKTQTAFSPKNLNAINFPDFLFRATTGAEISLARMAASAAKPPEPAPPEPAPLEPARHSAAAFDIFDAHDDRFSHLNGIPAAAPPERSAQPFPDGVGIHDQILAFGKALIEDERNKPSFHPIPRSDAERSPAMPRSRDRSSPAERAAPAATPHHTIHKSAQPLPQRARHVPTGRRDDPIIIRPV